MGGSEGVVWGGTCQLKLRKGSQSVGNDGGWAFGFVLEKTISRVSIENPNLWVQN